MNRDFRLQTGFVRHPKIKKLIKEGGYEAFYSLVCLYDSVAMYKPSGDVTSWDEEDIETAASWEGDSGVFVSLLYELRLLDKKKGKVFVHDWSFHNPWASGAEGRSERAKKAAGVRWKKGQKNNEKDATSIDEQCAKHKGAYAPSPSPSPSPSPIPKPKPKNKNKKDLDLSVIDPMIKREMVESFVEHRKLIKKPMTQLALVRNMKSALRCFNEKGIDPNEAIAITIEKGWQGVTPQWIYNTLTEARGSPMKQPRTMREASDAFTAQLAEQLLKEKESGDGEKRFGGESIGILDQ